MKGNTNRKIDIIFMNPPYSGSLHLKFLEKVIQISNNVISIQPCRWLQEVVSKYKKSSQYNKYKESISKHIKDFELIDSHKAKEQFNILSDNLGIYVCDKNGGYDYDSIGSDTIIEKVLSYINNNLCTIDHNKKDGYRIRIPLIGTGKAVGSGIRPPMLSNILWSNKKLVFKDGKKDGKWWYEYYGKNQHSKQTEEITSSLHFNSEEVANNFMKSLRTDFVRYVEDHLITDVNISNTKILWMGNAKHPRTGKTGYKDAWTSNDFYKYFELTTEEQNKVKQFIDDYQDKLNKWCKDNKKHIDFERE